MRGLHGFLQCELDAEHVNYAQDRVMGSLDYVSLLIQIFLVRELVITNL